LGNPNCLTAFLLTNRWCGSKFIRYERGNILQRDAGTVSRDAELDARERVAPEARERRAGESPHGRRSGEEEKESGRDSQTDRTECAMGKRQGGDGEAHRGGGERGWRLGESVWGVCEEFGGFGRGEVVSREGNRVDADFSKREIDTGRRRAQDRYFGSE